MSKPLRWIKHKDGTRKAYWYARITVNGKEKWISLGADGMVTKTAAQRKINEIERQVRLGQLDMIEAKIPTLLEFSEEYEEYIEHIQNVIRKRSWQRDKECLQNVKAFFPNRKLSEITPGDIDEYKRVRLFSVKPATVDRELAVLRHLFNLAERWKRFFGKNPVSTSGLLHPNNQVERILTPEEEERLLQHCNPYLAPIVITALNTGMRKMEIFSLKWANVDLENNLITIEHTNNKGKKERMPE